MHLYLYLHIHITYIYIHISWRKAKNVSNKDSSIQTNSNVFVQPIAHRLSTAPLKTKRLVVIAH